MKNNLFILTVFIAIFLMSCKQEKNESTISFPALNEEMLKKDQLMSLYNERTLLSKETQLVDSKGDTISLEEINKGISLVVRYSVHACGDCITFINRSLLEKNIDKKDILLFMSDIPIRDIHVLKKQLDMDEIYRVDSLDLPYDNEEIPYAFVLDSNYYISSFFVPRKEMPEQMDKYLDFIKNKRL